MNQKWFPQPQTGILKYDRWPLWKIIASDARNILANVAVILWHSCLPVFTRQSVVLHFFDLAVSSSDDVNLQSVHVSFSYYKDGSNFPQLKKIKKKKNN